MAVYSALVFVVGYLLGSIPSGYLIGKLKGVDLRTQGSGNIGATNAVRVLGKKWGYVVFAMDFLKGSIAVWLAMHGFFFLHHVMGDFPASCAGILAALACMIGHLFPVWLGFKGGKGISTSGGIILALFPLAVFVFAVSLWFITFFATRYVSIASLVGATALPVGLAVCYFLHLFGVDGWLLGTGIVMWTLAVWRHKSNIQRLLNGTEPRFEKKKKGAAA